MMKGAFAIFLLTALVIAGLSMAASDGPFFPWLNVAGIGVMGGGFLLMAGR